MTMFRQPVGHIAMVCRRYARFISDPAEVGTAEVEYLDFRLHASYLRNDTLPVIFMVFRSAAVEP